MSPAMSPALQPAAAAAVAGGVVAQGAQAAGGPAAAARIVDGGAAGWLAFAPRATVEIVAVEKLERVPGAAPWAYGLLSWQGTRIALMDLGAWLVPNAAAPVAGLRTPPAHALVLAYQRQRGAPIGHLAIALAALPETVWVRDADASRLPEGNRRLRHAARSCFRWNGAPVPILDVARLFDETD